jgi:ferredoxin
MKARVDRARCRGYGICTSIGPAVFALDDDGYATVDDRVLSPAEVEAVRQAEKLCPERAISTDEP